MTDQCKYTISYVVNIILCASESRLNMLMFLLPPSHIKMCCVYLATGSDPSGVLVAAAGSSGPPGGVGSRALRLGRI